MKDKLSAALGGLGMVLWYAIMTSLTIVPVLAADLPVWMTIIALILIYFTDVIGGLLTVVLYGYATYVVLVSPFTWFSIVFFIFLALYLVLFFIPATIQIFSKR